MSMYTTGEMAKLCGVTVRTVQYYDSRNILTPSQLSEGGRRLYSEEDLQKLKVICFLRNLDLSINSISDLFQEKNSEEVITLLLQQQEDTLREEIRERQEKLQTLTALSRELKAMPNFSVESISDIAYTMENKQKLTRTRMTLLAIGIPLELAEIAAIGLWVAKGIWWPFVLWFVVELLAVFPLFRYYHSKVAYICPECHQVFVPSRRESFFARHTPSLRKLTCTECGYHGFCIETYRPAEKE